MILMKFKKTFQLLIDFFERGMDRPCADRRFRPKVVWIYTAKLRDIMTLLEKSRKHKELISKPIFCYPKRTSLL